MKYLLLLAAIPLVLLGCNERRNAVSPDEFRDTTVPVPLNQSVSIPGTGLSLRFTKIMYDGRLPSGTIDSNWWTNVARIAVTIEPSNAKMQLYITGEVTDSSGVRFVGAPVVCQGYAFRIVELSPLPPALFVAPPDSEIVARIEIRDTMTASLPDACPFPLKLGNQWIYLDSTFSHDTLVSITIDTITIADEYTDMYGQWWKFSDYFPPFAWVVGGRGDTMYTQQDAYGPVEPGRSMYFPSKEFIPPVGDSSRFQVVFGGDAITYRYVATLDSAITTPIGSFDSGWRYNLDPRFFWGSCEILIPGTGFVYIESNFVPAKRMWLIEYHLQ